MYLHANTDFDATALPARNQDSCSSSSPSLNYYIYFFSRYIMYIIYINYIIKPTYIQSTHIRGGKKKNANRVQTLSNQTRGKQSDEANLIVYNQMYFHANV